MNKYFRLAQRNQRNIQGYELNPINVPNKILIKIFILSKQGDPRVLIGVDYKEKLEFS